MPRQLMCTECGDTREYFVIPQKKQEGWLTLAIRSNLSMIAAQGLNSTIPETRAYWRERLGVGE